MPDRYGDNADHEPQSLDVDAMAAYRRDVYAAIDACGLCDTDGNRNGFPCDHTDHAATTRRGMDLVRETMGWTQP